MRIFKASACEGAEEQLQRSNTILRCLSATPLNASNLLPWCFQRGIGNADAPQARHLTIWYCMWNLVSGARSRRNLPQPRCYVWIQPNSGNPTPSLRDTQTSQMGGLRSFAARWTNGSCAQQAGGRM